MRRMIAIRGGDTHAKYFRANGKLKDNKLVVNEFKLD